MENKKDYKLVGKNRYIEKNYTIPTKTDIGDKINAESAYYLSKGYEFIGDTETRQRITPDFSPNSITYCEQENIYEIEDVVKINKVGETVTIYITLDENGKQIGFISNNILDGCCFEFIFTGNIEESIENYTNYKKQLILEIINEKERKQKFRKENILKFEKNLR